VTARTVLRPQTFWALEAVPVSPSLEFLLLRGVVRPGRRMVDERQKFFLTTMPNSSILLNMSNYRTEEARRFADMFKALANPHRLIIFLRLLSCCPSCACTVSDEEARRYVGTLAAELSVAPSTVSHHMKELRQAGMVKMERRGKHIECSVDEGAVVALAELLAGKIPAGLV